MAWLNDVRQDFTIDGKKLIHLADAGVPDRVVDLLVALAYPDAFSVPPSPTSIGSLASSERDSGGGGGGFSDFGGVDTFGCANDFSVFGWDRCSPFSYAPFGILAAGVLPYAYGPYGGYGGWYTGDPGVIVIRGDSGPHGQVVNGRGYTANTGGATATATTSAGSTSSSSAGTSSTASAPASSSGGTASSSGSTSSSGGDRTAHPR